MSKTLGARSLLPQNSGGGVTDTMAFKGLATVELVKVIKYKDQSPLFTFVDLLYVQ